MKKILVVGSLNMDMTVHVGHMPECGETIICKGMSMSPGGKGANQAYAAATLGGNVSFLGAVGNDTYGKQAVDNLASAGVDIMPVIKKDDVPTGNAFIMINDDGDNSIVVVSGANAAINCDDIDHWTKEFETADYVLLQMEIPIETVLYAAEKAKALNKTVILDPAPVPESFPEELYQYVDYIKPNKTELSMLTHIENVEDCLEEATTALRKKGVQNVIVSLGEKGAYVNSKEYGLMTISGQKVNAVDTTAAGDTFIAAIAVMLANGKNLPEAINFANIAASISVTRPGAQSSVPSLTEVNRINQEND